MLSWRTRKNELIYKRNLVASISHDIKTPLTIIAATISAIQDGIFTDKGYLSCTSDFDSFINHVEGVNIACLQFDIPESFKCIDVCVLLPDYNNEREIILPRGLRFLIEPIQVYSTYRWYIPTKPSKPHHRMPICSFLPTTYLHSSCAW